MKIAILSFQPVTKKASREEIRLLKAARQLGHIGRIFRVEKCQLVYDNHHPQVLYDGEKFPKYDVIIPRASVLTNVELKVAIVKQFELMGYPIVNNYGAIARAKNKLRTLQILDHFGIPIPRTIVVRQFKYLDDAIKKVGGPPVIMKTPFGSFGSGVVIAESKRAVTSALDFFWEMSDENIILIQEYVKEAKGRDIRIFVVGERVVGAMMRASKRGEFRSNMELGAESSLVEITDEERDIAIRATKAVRLDIAGVDIMRSKNGAIVLEVNSNPGFKALEAVTGKDIASEMIRYAVQKVASVRQHQFSLNAKPGKSSADAVTSLISL